MSYKVCIPTAGTGSRLGELTRYLNKSLVGIANRPIICHLLEQFPADAKFVIALGYKGNLVQEFLELAYPDRHFDYAHVVPFEGEGSGLGLSLLACKQHLQEPFVFISCDTLVDEFIPPPDKNWMGYAEVQDLDHYRTLEVAYDRVIEICEKGAGKFTGYKPYIGLAGIANHEAFWMAMESGGPKAIQAGEAHGLRALLSNGIEAKSFTWHDTGNVDALIRAREFYCDPDEPNILEKANEAIWFVGNHAIKFSNDKEFISNRVERAKELEGFVPSITGSGVNMYRYVKAEGRIFSDVVNLPLFKSLLDHSAQFWRLEALNAKDKLSFKEKCLWFYRDKTYERVKLFYKNFSREDGAEKINGLSMPLLKDLLDSIDWDWLADGLAGRFHGDFHFENILLTSSDRKFIFLDWRQDFGGDISTGDIYYDFAKLLHGLIVNHELIVGNYYSINWNDDVINYDFNRKQILVDCEKYFEIWIKDRGYDQKKVLTLTALIYLNIAALHHYPYGLLLYALGKSILKKQLESK
ncbi:phosphotransferase [Polynucleobacter sp. MWH-UH24A]|uniref:phosphotransferase n=1 Tax=Polynucleobacter sp. MWH-UH24A TaxID=2689110 RepID=UPI001BFE7D09|nr:phosphotransferase [Polynucleobacter sp. MWH-UH24A]QWD76404.1 phosphotransferase [Polynucleobacter sp. MWH-UH24A]